MTIERKEVDYTPSHIDMTSFLRTKIATYYGIKIDRLEQKIGDHLLQFEYQSDSSYKQPHLDKKALQLMNLELNGISERKILVIGEW